MNQPLTRFPPWRAGPALSVMLGSLLGIPAMTGVLPNSHAAAAQTAPITAQAPAVAPISAPAQQVAAAPAVRDKGAMHKTVVHHHPVQHAQVQSGQQYSQAPAYQQPAPAAQNSP